MKAARACPDAVGDLLDELQRPIAARAARFHPNDRADAVQAAKVAIWQALQKVDTKRPAHQVRAFLVTTANRAMYDVGRIVRRDRGRADIVDAAVWDTIAEDVVVDDDPKRWPWIVRLYAEYHSDKGTLVGADRAVGERLGISPLAARGRIRLTLALAYGADRFPPGKLTSAQRQKIRRIEAQKESDKNVKQG